MKVRIYPTGWLEGNYIEHVKIDEVKFADVGCGYAQSRITETDRRIVYINQANVIAVLLESENRQTEAG